MRRQILRILALYCLLLPTPGYAKYLEVASNFKNTYEGQWEGFCTSLAYETEEFPRGWEECNYQFMSDYEEMFQPENGYCYATTLYNTLKHAEHITIKNNFVIDGDRRVFLLLQKYRGACVVLALQDESIANNSAQLRNALHILYTQYAEEDTWPMPTKALQQQWHATFGSDPSFTQEQRAFLFTRWNAYLKDNMENVKRWLPRLRKQ